jgi:ABC-type glycerol-3-phosphate transport system substrate-binding protein
MIRKTIASFLVLSMVLGLTACSGGQQTSETGNETDTQEAASGEETESTESEEEEVPAEIPQ